MSNAFFTERLENLLRRYDSSKPESFNELILLSEKRLESLTRRLLGREEYVHRWQQTGDVLQNATLRLHRALVEIRPTNKKEFFSLAATMVRREILDLARKLRSQKSDAAHHHTTFADQTGSDRDDEADWEGREDSSPMTNLLFHEAADHLTGEELTIVELIAYQGMEVEQAAETLGVSLRTAQRRWRNARLKIEEFFENN